MMQKGQGVGLGSVRSGMVGGRDGGVLCGCLVGE